MKTSSNAAVMFSSIASVTAIVMGVVFVYAGLSHARNPYGFLASVHRYDLVSAGVAYWIAVALPVIELVLGICLILRVFPRISAFVAFVLSVSFLVAISSVYVRGINVPCGCFGLSDSEPISIHTIARSFLFLLFASTLVFAESAASRTSGSWLRASRPKIAIRQTVRPGMTLVELLVVLAIIGVLAAIAIPAIQSARATARRATCMNNLRQIGLAAQQHESALGHFPTNGWGWSWAGVAERGYGLHQPGGWIFNLLPFTENEALRDALGQSSPALHDPSAFQNVVNQPVKLFLCPERAASMPAPSDRTLRYYGQFPITFCAKGDYAGNGGGESGYGGIPGPASFEEGDRQAAAWLPPFKMDGVIHLRSRTRIAEITDGTSATILVGEKWVGFKDYDQATDGYDQPLLASDCLDTRRWTEGSPAQDTALSDGNAFVFGSAHTGGAGFVFCDGSTRIITYTINPYVFKVFGTRSGGDRENVE